jgi:hypothetical protein
MARAFAEAGRISERAAVLFQCPARRLRAKMAGASGWKSLQQREKYFCAESK